MNMEKSGRLAIRAANLTKTYKLYGNVTDQAIDVMDLNKLFFWHKINPTHFQALGGISFTIAHGERVGIIGQNGAGKTTLLKLITGAISHTGGELVTNGDIQALMQVGLGFHPEFTGRENIGASLLYSGLMADDKKAAEEDIIDFCELGQFLDQPLKTYSLGMQSRLQFACATAIKPDILVVDEILGAGDAYFSIKSSARMERLTKSGCTLLLVSHSMGQVLQFCGRVIWISDGMIKRDGVPRDVIGEYEVFMQEKAHRIEIPNSGNEVEPEDKLSLKLARVHGVKNTQPESASIAVETAEKLPETADSTQNGERPDMKLSQSRVRNDFGSDSSKIQLSDGQWGYRWPSEKGVKLTKLGIYHKDGPVDRIREGSVVEFKGEVLCETSDALSYWYFIRINSIDGKYITMICSPKVTLNVNNGETRNFSARMNPCLLGEGEYYVAFNIIPGDDSIELPTRRYDLVSNFCDFSVYRTLNYIESSIYKQPAQWAV